MKTTTNTRELKGASQAECKCMALMLHFGNPYFVDGNGTLYQGSEEEARKAHEKQINAGEIDYIDFENWLHEYGEFEPLDASLDSIKDVGYIVLDCSFSGEIQDHKDLIIGQPLAGMEVINDTLYLIFQINQ